MAPPHSHDPIKSGGKTLTQTQKKRRDEKKRKRTYNSGIWEEGEGSVAWLAQGRGENEREREIGRGIDLEGGGLLILKECEQTRLN